MDDMDIVFQLQLIVCALFLYVLLPNVMQVPDPDILIHPDAVLLLGPSSFIWNALHW